MEILVQLNEIAITLAKAPCDKEAGAMSHQSIVKDADLELACQVLNVALNHASGVVRALLVSHEHLLSTANEKKEGSTFPTRPPVESRANNHVQQEDVLQPSQLLHIVGLHETNAVCLLWYNLGLVRSRQHRWAEAKANLSIVASLASAVFLQERILPLLVYVEAHLLEDEQSTSNSIVTKLQQRTNNECAAAWHCIHALLATTAILGTAFHPNVAEILQALGNVYSSSGQSTSRQKQLAISFYFVELTVERTLWGPTHPNIVSTLSSIVALHVSQCHHSLAYECLQEIYQLQILQGESAPRVASTLWDMGVLQYSKQDDYPAALKLFQQALQLLRSAAEAHHVQPFQREIAATLNSIGFVLQRMNQHELALGYCSEALRMLRSLQLPHSPSITESRLRSSSAKDLFRTLYHIALLHSELGHSATAWSYFQQATHQGVEAETNTEQQQLHRVELVKIFFIMAKLSRDEASNPQQALRCCDKAAESLAAVAASCDGDAQQQEQRRHWIQLAELRLGCGDIDGGMQTCIHLARHFDTSSINNMRSPQMWYYSFPERSVSAYYVTKVALGASSGAAA